MFDGIGREVGAGSGAAQVEGPRAEEKKGEAAGDIPGGELVRGGVEDHGQFVGQPNRWRWSQPQPTQLVRSEDLVGTGLAVVADDTSRDYAERAFGLDQKVRTRTAAVGTGGDERLKIGRVEAARAFSRVG